MALSTGAPPFKAAVTASAAQLTLMPIAEPTITRDPWYCATENIAQYFDVPKPTGALLDELLIYGDKLIEDCTLTITPSATVVPTCPFPEWTSWCGFTTAAPREVLPAYSSHGSVASSWWAAHSSRAVEVVQRCPNTWIREMREALWGEVWLNDTIAFAACYAEEHEIDKPSTTTQSKSGSLETTSTISTIVPTQAQVTAKTALPNSVIGRVESVKVIVVAGAGIAAAAVNSVL